MPRRTRITELREADRVLHMSCSEYVGELTVRIIGEVANAVRWKGLSLGAFFEGPCEGNRTWLYRPVNFYTTRLGAERATDNSWVRLNGLRGADRTGAQTIKREAAYCVHSRELNAVLRSIAPAETDVRRSGFIRWFHIHAPWPARRR